MFVNLIIKKYQDRKAELAEGGFAHADTDQFVTYLYDGTIDLFKKGSLLEDLPVDFEDESGKELYNHIENICKQFHLL